MKSKVLVGILLFALMTVCIIAGGLGFMLWQQRQATAAAPVAQAAEPDPALLAAGPEVEPEAAEPVETPVEMVMIEADVNDAGNEQTEAE